MNELKVVRILEMIFLFLHCTTIRLFLGFYLLTVCEGAVKKLKYVEGAEGSWCV